MKFNGKISRIYNQVKLPIRSSLFSTQVGAIRNGDINACKNCMYYRPKPFGTDFTSCLNKCSRFGEKDIITDEITYDYADSCRKDESKCGKIGKEFKREPRLWLKKLKYAAFHPATMLCYYLVFMGWIVIR